MGTVEQDTVAYDRKQSDLENIHTRIHDRFIGMDIEDVLDEAWEESIDLYQVICSHWAARGIDADVYNLIKCLQEGEKDVVLNNEKLLILYCGMDCDKAVRRKVIDELYEKAASDYEWS